MTELISERKLAPIVIFVFNRPTHTKATLQSLINNYLAKESHLFIFSDAPRQDSDYGAVSEVRHLIRSISGFKTITIIERERNFGLANSIIDGVSSVINSYGKIIVLEDDIITSPAFLNFMNVLLDYYNLDKKIWHISGWNYPISCEGLGDVFPWRLMNCWGWATWSDRWNHFQKNPKDLIRSMSFARISKFNLDGGNDFWGQVVNNFSGKLNTWAIFWYSTIYTNDGLCINPANTYVENIGLDGSGINCKVDDVFQQKNLNLNLQPKLYHSHLESEIALSRVKSFYATKRKIYYMFFLQEAKRFVRNFVAKLRVLICRK